MFYFSYKVKIADEFEKKFESQEDEFIIINENIDLLNKKDE